MKLAEEIAAALKRASSENGSNTPDFILAKYLLGCLWAFDVAVKARDDWYGVALRPGASDFSARSEPIIGMTVAEFNEALAYRTPAKAEETPSTTKSVAISSPLVVGAKAEETKPGLWSVETDYDGGVFLNAPDGVWRAEVLGEFPEPSMSWANEMVLALNRGTAPPREEAKAAPPDARQLAIEALERIVASHERAEAGLTDGWGKRMPDYATAYGILRTFVHECSIALAALRSAPALDAIAVAEAVMEACISACQDIPHGPLPFDRADVVEALKAIDLEALLK
jgi:hypothetical protein